DLPREACGDWVEQPRGVGRRAVLRDHRPAGHAVARVDLAPALGEQWPAGVAQAEPLDLLGIPAGGREHQHRPAVTAPPSDGDLLIEAVGEPPLGRLHAVTRRRTSAGRGISMTALPVAGRATFPHFARPLLRRNARPCRPPPMWEPWAGS